MQTGNDASENYHICPHLGQIDDAQTSLAFPSIWNHCHHCRPVSSIHLDHQREYCLTPQYKRCAVYSLEANGPLPRQLRNPRPVPYRPGKPLRKILLLLILLAALSLLVWKLAPFLDIGSFLGSTLTTLNTTATPPALPLALPVLDAVSNARTPLPGATATATGFLLPVVLPPAQDPSAGTTVTSTPRLHSLEALVGGDYLFRIHHVQRGENLDILAAANGTTVAALTAVNYNFAIPLWADEVIVIPVDRLDVSGLPPFLAYRVTEDTSIEKLADQLGVDAGKLRTYNGLEARDGLFQDEWIIVPREE